MGCELAAPESMLKRAPRGFVEAGNGVRPIYRRTKCRSKTVSLPDCVFVHLSEK
jgi:hypothetical protein